ncbi:galactose mutarotase isoform X2 [Felis catus]|uniref:galactose mutarotase isoform X2 n=1 Tax=Felis catus TaxID=9685 RepID=UPI001D19C3B1|nr:galactose mutarotase isoform X2 [Felis catus]
MVSVTRAVFGDLPSGAGTVEKFQLQSDLLKVDIISWGCTITALEVKDRQGRASDVVLGFAELEGYLQKQPYFGAVVGRVANRIAKGTFTVDGKEYKLAVNNGPNSLHGGVRGFDKVVWTPQVLSNGVQFSRISPDGEEGYPGELKVWVTYTLDGGELMVNYRAQASQTTPVNLTNHSYFNLAGQGSPNIYDHEVTIEADAFLPVDETLIPTGEVAPVQGTAFDLRKPVELGKHLQEFRIHGFDHNFCLKGSKDKHFCARVHHAGSGRVLEVYTTQPGVQFYTGNFLDGTLKGKSGAVYPKHSGFCLETQSWPDAVNQQPVEIKPELAPSEDSQGLRSSLNLSDTDLWEIDQVLGMFLIPLCSSGSPSTFLEENHLTGRLLSFPYFLSNNKPKEAFIFLNAFQHEFSGYLLCIQFSAES